MISHPDEHERDRLFALSLRSDLEMRPAMPDVDGSDGWILHDPLQHRFFRLDEATHHLFTLWLEQGSLAAALVAYCDETGQTVGEDHMQSVASFAQKGNLVIDETPGKWRDYSSNSTPGHAGALRQLAHRYLFFKLPLFRPQRALERCLPLVGWLMTRPVAYALGLMALLSLGLISRQWDAFWHSMVSAMNIEGAIGFFVAIVLLKAAHELGHAFVALRFGCRMPVMGVAFMMLTPMLYTDVSDAWRLPSRKKRLLISSAGILVELGLATVASLIWIFLPDGTLRGIAFYIASSAWVMSLAVNLNPCMRFDGYYLLGDWLGVENLQPRAFALGKWKLRQWFLAPGLEAPETMPPRLQTGLVVYAFATWIYRIILFTTIALMVYHFAFKLLGILLFCLEIGLLLVAPVARELMEWRRIPSPLRSPRRMTLSLGLIGAALLLLVVPMPGRVSVPAVLTPADLAKLYAERAGRIVAVHAAPGDQLQAGAVLMDLEAPKLKSEIEIAIIRKTLLEAKLQGAISDPKTLEQSVVLRGEISSLEASLKGLMSLDGTLDLKSPITGRVLQMPPDLHAGRWIKKGALLALVSSGKAHSVKGYIDEADLERLRTASAGRFIPDDIQLQSFPVSLVRIAPANSPVIEIAELAATQGGPIPIRSDAAKTLIPQHPQYRIDLAAQSLPFDPAYVIRGQVHLDARPESRLVRGVRQVARVLVRESGF